MYKKAGKRGTYGGLVSDATQKDHPKRGGKKLIIRRLSPEATAKILESGISPVEFLTKIYRDSNVPLSLRMQAAREVAPYLQPRLAQVSHTNKDGGPLVVQVVRFSDGGEEKEKVIIAPKGADDEQE